MTLTKVKDVMTRDVLTVRAEAPFKDVVRLMHEHRVSGVPVIDKEGHLLGILSEADLLRAGEETVEPRRRRRFIEWFVDRELLERVERRSPDLRAGDLMTREVVTARPDESVRRAIRTLLEADVKRLPVVDDAGRVVGIVSRGDLLSPFLRSDEEIRREIERDVILGGMWRDPHAIRADVTGGVVRLEGAVEDEEEEAILVRTVSRVDGVVGVEPRLRHRAVTRG